MDRVLMLTADSGEELEVYYMLYRLREAGYAVDVAAPQRKRLELVVHDFQPGWDTYIERPGRGLRFRRKPIFRGARAPESPSLAWQLSSVRLRSWGSDQGEIRGGGSRPRTPFFPWTEGDARSAH